MGHLKMPHCLESVILLGCNKIPIYPFSDPAINPRIK
jgi:hypothetical protein